LESSDLHGRVPPPLPAPFFSLRFSITLYQLLSAFGVQFGTIFWYFGITFAVMVFVSICLSLLASISTRFPCFSVPFQIVNASTKTLDFDDPYGAFACSGPSGKQSFSVFSYYYLLPFLGWIFTGFHHESIIYFGAIFV
jgi:hypothetical protein